jgi:hypothetical protein
MVPMVEDLRVLAELSDILGPHTGLVALADTTLGLHRAYELATVSGVARVAFGLLGVGTESRFLDAFRAFLPGGGILCSGCSCSGGRRHG